MFDIKEGDTLMVMGDKERGIALIKDEMFYKLMGGMFNNGNSNQKYKNFLFRHFIEHNQICNTTAVRICLCAPSGFLFYYSIENRRRIQKYKCHDLAGELL